MTEGNYEDNLDTRALIGLEDGNQNHSIQMVSLDSNAGDVESTFPESLDILKTPSSAECVTASYLKDITVKGSIFSSAFLSFNQLIAADYENSKVRLVDTDSGKQVSEKKLTGRPWQVTKISATEAAVTLPFKRKIVLLKTHEHEQRTDKVLALKPQLSVVSDIRVQEECYGIANADKILIVTFLRGRIDIIHISGKVLNTISAGQPGDSIFYFPHYVTVNSVTGSLYVSDRDTRKVVKLSLKGKEMATYSTDTIGYPNQVTLDSQGNVFLALRGRYGRAGCVEQLTEHSEKVRTVIHDLTVSTSALSFDESTRQLYVGQGNSVIRVYRLS